MTLMSLALPRFNPSTACLLLPLGIRGPNVQGESLFSFGKKNLLTLVSRQCDKSSLKAGAFSARYAFSFTLGWSVP